jgi:hypothetical protein
MPPEGEVATPPKTPPPPPNAAPPGAGKQSITEWARNHKAATIGGGIALALGVFMFARWRSSQSGSSTSATTSSSDTTPSVYQLAPGAYEGWDGTTGQSSTDLSTLLQQIEQQLSGQTTTTAPSTPTPTTPYNYSSEKFIGGGYLGTGEVPGRSGGNYENIPGGMGTYNLEQQGVSVYWQPTPGVFEKVNPATFKQPTTGPHTPFYTKV